MRTLLTGICGTVLMRSLRSRKCNRCIHINRKSLPCGRPGMPRQRSWPSVRLRRLAAQLRELREECGMTQEDVSERTGKDRSTLYRLENAQQRPQRSTLIQLLDLYRVEQPRRGELLRLLRDAGQRGWLQHDRSELPDAYADYTGFEEGARPMSTYE